MKAIVCRKYGSPLNLMLEEVARPIPKGRNILIKVEAAAINDYDWSMVRGKPYLYRLLFGFFKPKHPIPGMEIAGIVEDTGPGSTLFKKGDAVFGDISEYGFGGFAEYISIHENAVRKKPDSMSFVEAASVPHAANLAIQALFDYGKIQTGQKILINGAGGGVGTLAFQMAKLYQAEVTGVDSGSKLNKLRELGFDHLIDYREQDLTRMGILYDLIVDAKTTRSPFAYLRALKPGGKYITVGGNLTRILQLAFCKGFIRKVYKKTTEIVPLKINKDLDKISHWFMEGNLNPVIDGPYPMEDIPRLIQYFGEGKHIGKLVISMQQTEVEKSSFLK